MADSIKEQVLNSCVHFTGIMNKVCAKGIPYSEKLPELPCMKSHGQPCISQHFPTAEEAEKQVAEIIVDGLAAMRAIALIRERYHKTETPAGEIRCTSPACVGAIRYVIASNGHIWLHCPVCNLNVNE